MHTIDANYYDIHCNNKSFLFTRMCNLVHIHTHTHILTFIQLSNAHIHAGYGAAFGGLAPLLNMLNSCSPGVSVVNIDNGFGAAVSAYKMVQLTKKRVK